MVTFCRGLPPSGRWQAVLQTDGQTVLAPKLPPTGCRCPGRSTASPLALEPFGTTTEQHCIHRQVPRQGPSEDTWSERSGTSATTFVNIITISSSNHQPRPLVRAAASVDCRVHRAECSVAVVAAAAAAENQAFLKLSAPLDSGSSSSDSKEPSLSASVCV